MCCCNDQITGDTAEATTERQVDPTTVPTIPPLITTKQRVVTLPPPPNVTESDSSVDNSTEQVVTQGRVGDLPLCPDLLYHQMSKHGHVSDCFHHVIYSESGQKYGWSGRVGETPL